MIKNNNDNNDNTSSNNNNNNSNNSIPKSRSIFSNCSPGPPPRDE